MENTEYARELIKITQRIENLTYVLAMDPNHGAALTALHDAIEQGAAEAERRSSTALFEVVTEMRRLTERPMNGDNAEELRAAAARFHDAAVRAIGIPRATGDEAVEKRPRRDNDA